VKKWILAHRGEWNQDVPANSAASLNGAILHGFGIETDIRDQDSELVISHDPCTNAEYERFEQFLRQDSRIAINIKSDGLLTKLEPMRSLITDSKSFVFDCSFPELLRFKRAGIPHAIRKESSTGNQITSGSMLLSPIGGSKMQLH
jgi:glycerophosphoryl diester phosphodiesterase